MAKRPKRKLELTKRLEVRISPQELAELERGAEKEGMSVSAFVRWLLRKGLESKDRK